MILWCAIRRDRKSNFFLSLPSRGDSRIWPASGSWLRRWIPEYIEKANEEVLIILQIEHFETIENLEEISR